MEKILMLEEKEEVVAIVKDAMREAGLTQNGRIEFHPLLPDSVGLAEPNQPPVWQAAPRWIVNLQYPTDSDEPAGTYSFQINTSDFQNKEQIKSFVISEIKRQM
jgi:hypothetical protein